MKKLLLYLNGLLLLLLISNPAVASNISVEVISDQGYAFPTYPTDSYNGNYRAYLQAQRNESYGIRVTNHTNGRIGLVVAVDGRNILSGTQSQLHRKEKMYVIDPYATATYSGWRTNRNEVRRFYFTNESASYAGAWGDYSAMGVIAIAAYGERRPQVYPAPVARRPSRFSTGSDTLMAAPRALASAGTGYGESEYSSSRQVEFKPKRRAFEKHFYKYEWRKSLCEKGIISCRRPHRRDSNRFWRDDGYVPAPPTPIYRPLYRRR
jgi:hypothetical protein